jgi:nucleoside 2-deoxyribosyltransferase
MSVTEHEQPVALVSVPFDAVGKEVYASVAKVLEAAGVRPFYLLEEPRTEFAWLPLRAMDSADLLIADVSRKDPSVMYEIGLAHARRKPTIIITSTEEESIPSILAGFSYLVYDPKNLGEFENALTRHVSKFVERESR